MMSKLPLRYRKVQEKKLCSRVIGLQNFDLQQRMVSARRLRCLEHRVLVWGSKELCLWSCRLVEQDFAQTMQGTQQCSTSSRGTRVFSLSPIGRLAGRTRAPWTNRVSDNLAHPLAFDGR
ncbi:hypothetical protein KSP39_PZI000875 [Platanthera zijinensis]|uniref:Uncharacterized protein n=1 Tax=Platanthera zijinensis TaxID=2320716 RepID=A0AAP0GFB4_9ASPA